MNILKKLFGQKNRKTKTYRECDNVGTRIENSDQSQSLTMSGMVSGQDVVAVYYRFPSASAALKGLTGISCIHMTVDSENIISTEPIAFGGYQDPYFEPPENWVAVIRGVGISEELYKEAIESFEKNGGALVDKIEPVSNPEQENIQDFDSSLGTEVKLSQKIDLAEQGGIGTKEIYTAPGKEAAMEFLRGQTINAEYYYIEINTPDGGFGKDKEGTYSF